MSSRFLSRNLQALLSLCLLAVPACSSEARKARHLERGDEYFAQEQYPEAILEYRNVLQIEEANSHAIRQLGLSHFELGEIGQAFPMLLNAKEHDPADVEVRRRLGVIYLLGRQLDEARQEATDILAQDPDNLDALVLLADASQTADEAAALLTRLEGVQSQYEGEAKFHLALGNLHIKQGDIESAEREFTEAAEREPGSVIAHESLAKFYLAKRDLEKAEAELETAAGLEDAGPAVRMRLADFYLATNRREESKEILETIVGESPDFVPARHRLAAMAFEEGDVDGSLEIVEALLAENELDPVALALRGRIHLFYRETNEAIQSFQKILELQPRHPPTRYLLAQAHVQAGNIQQAKSELREAVEIAPQYADALFLLAQLNIQTGAPEPAIEDLTAFIETRPRVPQAHQLLGSAYLQNQDPTRATEAFRQFAALAPDDPRGPYLIGLALENGGRSVEAQREFEAALAMEPGFADALGRLVFMDFANNRADAALARVNRQIALAPDSAGLQFLLGKTYQQRRDLPAAETAFLKAIELQPRLVEAYTELGTLYAARGNYDEALAKLSEGLAASPDNPLVLLLSGIVHQQKGDVPQATQVYERVLELNPQAAVAANNLAYLYSEYGGDPDKALELAQRAKEIAPDDPSVSDTLGWILYKRGVYQRALGFLQDSASKVPDNAEIQYHLGMTLYQLQDHAGAQRALSRALELDSGFSGADEARSTLASIG